ncbi:FHA domain-containing protein [Rubricoccus marinus]|uniref:FHA domain-containing protein n=1 Tax=Rubricoccus marinus TaxID=716817 RepID=A0A259TYS0_9BACT|nr:FHA domain-containing protein [Rubricoccus marinus]OZC02724.1 hypothetical protein BSZ36_06900 [Rubricoccus marinus]
MQTLTLRWSHRSHHHERAFAQGQSAVIGRDPACDVSLPADDRTVHRRHAEIIWDGGAPSIRVIGQNGARVDSHAGKLRQGETARLAATDRIRIGASEIEAVYHRATAGPRKLRCHNCNRVQDYAPEGMCVHCGFALASAETVFIQE